MAIEAPMVSSIVPPDEQRIPRSARFNVHSPRASSENNRPKAETPDLYALTQDSPPRRQRDEKTTPTTLPTPLGIEDTIALFKKRLEAAQQHNDQVLESEGVTDVVKPKLTLDIGHSNLARLPEAVVDVIKDHVDRLSLSNNQIWHMSGRFSECIHLRYLNVRSNVFRDIPRGIFKLTSLEILDISRNKIRKISRDIRNLTSLRVLSIIHNRIDDLPTDMCDMNMLEMIKIADNPLRFKLKKIIEAKEAEVLFSELTEQEREKSITVEIKRYLRAAHPIVPPIDVEVAQQYEESPMETPKPAKRILSSRFPVIPSNNTSDGSSPPTGTWNNPPPIPTRSHQRMASGQSMALKRPGIAPLISSDRLRSNSETTVQNPRTKRMGMAPLAKAKPGLDSIDESRANRNSHLRGISHNSALRRGGVLASPGFSNASYSPNSPRDTRGRNRVIKRLSSLPEYKLEQEWHNPVVQGARGILYALYQVHPHISGLIQANPAHESKRSSSLEAIFYSAAAMVDRLNESLEFADSIDPEDVEAVEKAEEMVQEDCSHCITAYVQVAARLQDSLRRIVAGSDLRYVRTLMLLLYGSIAEVRNAVSSLGIDIKIVSRGHQRQKSSGHKHSIQTIPEESADQVEIRRSATPTQDGIVHQRPGMRLRSETTIQHGVSEPTHPQANPSLGAINLTGTTVNGTIHSSSSSSTMNGTTTQGSAYGSRSRSNSRTMNSGPVSLASSVASTPRSGDGFHLPRSTSYFARVNPSTGMTESQEEYTFGQIFMSLTRSYEAALAAVPLAKEHFSRCVETSKDGQQSRAIHDLWATLVYRCKQCYEVSEALQLRLTSMRIKDEVGRNDPSFWLLCKTFLQSFVDLVTEMREVRSLRLLPPELIVILRPVQKTSREAGRLIQQSPWSNLTDGVSTMPAPTPYSSVNGAPPPLRSDSYANNIQGAPARSDSYTNLNGYGNVSRFPAKESMTSHVQRPQLHHMHTSPSIISTAPAVQQPDSASSVPSASAYPGFDRLAGPSPLTSPLPATPLSAALGPAAAATVPTSGFPTAISTTGNPMAAALAAQGPGWTIKPQHRDINGDEMPPTPATASLVPLGGTERSNANGYGGDHVFRGDVFQRADTLLSSMNNTGGGMNWSIRR
ncbi:Leucine-rich repeat-containing protein sog2 [Cyphellophora attinorum]|uniref:Leucine-rich repeat-containing protein sog2 n=1 Tax=Cyphellophora attinorum TaxID=1664694 RepID=A0A0N1HCN0_9EURO|nr:Leucine-rich repeat-containing protein sog2 [Phialophora attinorum]KPI41633.1 Leucine-rich repeat-containing protein sog2 [Phialophora attinorum]